MLLHFIRHGQTDFNIDHRLQGRALDEPLNDEGIKEIQELLPKLPKDFEVIYSAPLKRAMMSAEIIAENSEKPILERAEISERDFGSLAGHTWKEIPDGTKLQELDRNQQYDYHPYGGESVEDVTARVKSFLEYAKASGYKSALAVTSVGIMRLVYKILENKSIIDIPNASVHTFRI